MLESVHGAEVYSPQEIQAQKERAYQDLAEYFGFDIKERSLDDPFDDEDRDAIAMKAGAVRLGYVIQHLESISQLAKLEMEKLPAHHQMERARLEEEAKTMTEFASSLTKIQNDSNYWRQHEAQRQAERSKAHQDPQLET